MGNTPTAWECTDPDEGQWGRKLSEFLFEFKDDITPATVIDLTYYRNGQIEDIINAYGYSLLRKDGYKDIHEHPDKNWLIAECIFEMEFATPRMVNQGAPRFVIIIKGGSVQEVYGTSEMDYAIVNYDMDDPVEGVFATVEGPDDLKELFTPDAAVAGEDPEKLKRIYNSLKALKF